MARKQQLQLEIKNTPAGAPLARCSVSPQLNKVERPREVDIVLGCNNTEVDRQESHPEYDSKKEVHVTKMVFVLSVEGKPLMLCKPSKARKLLNAGRAKVVKARPFFTIQLRQQSGGNRQEITLGVDTGYENIGFALVGENTCYVNGEIKLDNMTSKRLKKRAEHRQARRRKHHWYRPKRFQNRANARKKGRLMPSVQKRLNRHIWLVEKLSANTSSSHHSS